MKSQQFWKGERGFLFQKKKLYSKSFFLQKILQKVPVVIYNNECTVPNLLDQIYGSTDIFELVAAVNTVLAYSVFFWPATEKGPVLWEGPKMEIRAF